MTKEPLLKGLYPHEGSAAELVPAYYATAVEVSDICTEHASRGSYRMYASCQVCQTYALMTITKGHEPPAFYQSGPECPTCGNRRWGRFVLKTESKGGNAGS